MKRSLATLLAIGLACSALADGKMYLREPVPPGLPYQRALILFEHDTETLLLQSQYALPAGLTNASLGWVVPAPAPPQLASMSAKSARSLFQEMAYVSHPNVTHVTPILFAGLLVISMATTLAAFALLVVSHSRFQTDALVDRRALLGRLSRYGFLFSFFLALIVPSLVNARGKVGVDVLSERSVGIYDVSVVRADQPGELIAWLNARAFRFGPEDTAAFASYVSNGWCFVVANINPERSDDRAAFGPEELADPLILRFPCRQPVYPLALTGTGGYDTQVLLYLAATTQMTCDERLPRLYAGRMTPWIREWLGMGSEPAGFIRYESSATNELFLMKFKATLTPAQMRTDLVFQPTTNLAPYREHRFMW